MIVSSATSNTEKSFSLLSFLFRTIARNCERRFRQPSNGVHSRDRKVDFFGYFEESVVDSLDKEKVPTGSSSHKIYPATATNCQRPQPQNMKFSSTISLGLYIMASSPTTSTAQLIGLAIATEHPNMHPANACAQQDTMILDEIAAAMISEELLQAQLGSDGNRKLYQMSTTCKLSCRGFYPGTCWYVYPWCWPFRRSLRTLQTEPHVEPITDLVDDLEVDHSVDCAMSIIAAEAKMKALALTIDAGACRNALLEKKIYQCVHLKSRV
jgi:hypothetical protein